MLNGKSQRTEIGHNLFMSLLHGWKEKAGGGEQGQNTMVEVELA